MTGGCSGGVSGFWSPMDSTGVLKSDLVQVGSVWRCARRLTDPLGGSETHPYDSMIFRSSSVMP